MNRKNLLLAINKKGFERPKVPEGLFPLYLERDRGIGEIFI